MRGVACAAWCTYPALKVFLRANLADLAQLSDALGLEAEALVPVLRLPLRGLNLHFLRPLQDPVRHCVRRAGAQEGKEREAREKKRWGRRKGGDQPECEGG